MTSRSPGNPHDLIDPIAQAAHDLVHEYRSTRDDRRRGAAALAPMVGMNPGTLSNKVNPLQEHPLTLGESVQLQAVTGDYRILHAYAAVLGHAVYQLPESTDIGDIELLTRYAEFHARLGKQSSEIRRTLADGRVTAAEVELIEAAFHDVICTGLALLARFHALVR